MNNDQQSSPTGVWRQAVLRAGAGLRTALEAYHQATEPPLGALGAAVVTGGAYPLYRHGGENHNRPTEDLTAGEWRDLANCWRIIAKYGVDAKLSPDIANATNPPMEGVFPATDIECGRVTGGNGTILGDAFTISDRFRGRSMQLFMEEPAFRVYCVVARPFIEHVMQSAIMTVAGRDTGAMLFGPSDMCVAIFTPSNSCHSFANCKSYIVVAAYVYRQISANTQVKTIEG